MPHEVIETGEWVEVVTAPSNGDTADEIAENDPAQKLANRTRYNKNTHEAFAEETEERFTELETKLRNLGVGRFYAVSAQLQESLEYWEVGSMGAGTPHWAKQISLEIPGEVWLKIGTPWPYPRPDSFAGRKITGFGIRIHPETHSSVDSMTFPACELYSLRHGVRLQRGVAVPDSPVSLAGYNQSHDVSTDALNITLDTFDVDQGELWVKATGEHGENAVAGLRLITAWVDLGY